MLAQVNWECLAFRSRGAAVRGDVERRLDQVHGGESAPFADTEVEPGGVPVLRVREDRQPRSKGRVPRGAERGRHLQRSAFAPGRLEGDEAD